uniref:Uncharacterized protein n=1 Tax=Picea sitchensis TaxID=3332 RepID=A9NS62_PICSI|nr:unknown [Picea sitchensis]
MSLLKSVDLDVSYGIDRFGTELVKSGFVAPVRLFCLPNRFNCSILVTLAPLLDRWDFIFQEFHDCCFIDGMPFLS